MRRLLQATSCDRPNSAEPGRSTPSRRGPSCQAQWVRSRQQRVDEHELVAPKACTGQPGRPRTLAVEGNRFVPRTASAEAPRRARCSRTYERSPTNTGTPTAPFDEDRLRPVTWVSPSPSSFNSSAASARSRARSSRLSAVASATPQRAGRRAEPSRPSTGGAGSAEGRETARIERSRVPRVLIPLRVTTPNHPNGVVFGPTRLPEGGQGSLDAAPFPLSDTRRSAPELDEKDR